MSQSQLQAHPNPFAAPSDSLGSAVIWNPSRSVYESLRIAQIAFTVVAAYVLLTPFRQGSPEFHHVAAGFIIVAGTGYILIRELGAYWSEDATIERSVIRIQSGYSLCATAVSLLVLQSLGTTSTQYPIATLIIAAGWHITAIFRGSMLRQRLQFAVAQSGNPASTSLHLSATAQIEEATAWDADSETTDRPVKTLDERRQILLAWLGQHLLTKRALAILGVAAGFIFVAVLLANYLIPVEVARHEVRCDMDSFTASLLKKRGGLYAKCIDSQERKIDDGNWQLEQVIREVRVGNSETVLVGSPSISFDVSPYSLTFHVGNQEVAHYDGEARVFHVPDSR